MHDLAKELRERAALGLPPPSDLGRQRMAQIYRQAQRPVFEQRAEALSLTQMLDGWHLTDAEDQKKLLPILARKATAKAIANIPADQRQTVIDRIREILGGPAVESRY